MSSEPLPKTDQIGHLTPFPRRKMAQGPGARMARETRRTLMLRNTLPDGITIGRRNDGRDKPWFVRFGQRRVTESFADEQARNDRAQQLAAEVGASGRGILEFDPAKLRRLQEFEARTGMTLDEAEPIVMQVRGNLRLNLTADDAARRYMELRAAEGLPKASQIHPRLHLRRFCDCTTEETKLRYGAMPLIAFTADHVRHWLDELRRTGLDRVTLRHHRKNLNVFFRRAVLEEWCLKNPCAAVAPPKVPSATTPILSPQEIFQLLKANAEHAVVGRLAFELYGHLRRSSVARLIAADVRRATHGVLMRGASVNERDEWEQGHKSGVQKYRQGHPPVLWAWIDFCCPLPQPESGPPMFSEITEGNYGREKRAAFLRAGWSVIPRNRLRHCAASYLLAVTKNRSLVSHLMQHTSWKQLDRYEGVADETDAKMVLSMTPEAVITMEWPEFGRRWEEFYQPVTTNT